MVKMPWTWLSDTLCLQVLYFKCQPNYNLGSFIHKVVPHKRTRCNIIKSPLVYHNSKFYLVLRTLFLAFGTYEIEKIVLNLSMVVEQELSITVQAFGALQLEVNSVASVLFQNHCNLDALTAQ